MCLLKNKAARKGHLYTVRSEKQAGDESEKLWQLTVCSLFWLEPVTNEELASFFFLSSSSLKLFLFIFVETNHWFVFHNQNLLSTCTALFQRSLSSPPPRKKTSENGHNFLSVRRAVQCLWFRQAFQPEVWPHWCLWPRSLHSILALLTLTDWGLWQWHGHRRGHKTWTRAACTSSASSKSSDLSLGYRSANLVLYLAHPTLLHPRAFSLSSSHPPSLLSTLRAIRFRFISKITGTHTRERQWEKERERFPTDSKHVHIITFIFIL